MPSKRNVPTLSASVTFSGGISLPGQLLTHQHHINGRWVSCERRPEKSEKTMNETNKNLNLKLFVNKLPKKSTLAEITTYFERFGEVERVNIPYSNAGLSSKGFAFVTMSHAQGFFSVLSRASALQFKGKLISAIPALEKALSSSIKTKETPKSDKLPTNLNNNKRHSTQNSSS